MNKSLRIFCKNIEVHIRFVESSCTRLLDDHQRSTKTYLLHSKCRPPPSKRDKTNHRLSQWAAQRGRAPLQCVKILKLQ